MESTNSMCERILQTLENIFKTDPDLREFSVVQTETTNPTNKSPVLYEEHNIGLESWCIKYIYRYAYKELFDLRRQQQLGRRKLSFDQKQNLNHLLIGVLLINPDVTTLWNMKRELIDEQILLVDNELQFTKIVLSYKSKSNETLSYRRWLLKRILSKYLTNNSMVNIRNLLQNELEVCERAAEKSPNNYHAWNHRIWTIENFLKICDNPSNLLSNELEFSYQWIMKHVSEHAGYHYRQYLIDCIRTKDTTTLTNFDDYQRTIIDYFHFVIDDLNENRNILLILLFGKNNLQAFEGENNTQLINYLSLLLFDLFKTMNELFQIFPGHESVWYYRRYLIHRLVETIYNYYYHKNNNNNDDLSMKFHVKLDDSNFIQTNQLNIVDFDRPIFYIYSNNNNNNNNNEKQLKLSKRIPNRISDSFLYRTLIKNEDDFIKKNNFCTYVDDEYAKRYEKWLKLVLCLDLS